MSKKTNTRVTLLRLTTNGQKPQLLVCSGKAEATQILFSTAVAGFEKMFPGESMPKNRKALIEKYYGNDSDSTYAVENATTVTPELMARMNKRAEQIRSRSQGRSSKSSTARSRS